MTVELRKNGLLLLPVLAAVLLEASIRFVSFRTPDPLLLLQTHGQLLFEMLPFFIAHYAAWHSHRIKALLFWLAGFVGYPLAATAFAHHSATFNDWHLLGGQGYMLAAGASGMWFLHHLLGRVTQGASSWLSTLLSLDTMVVVCLVIWTFTMAGVFLHNVDPMINQPLAMIIDFAQIVNELPLFTHYFWQFGVMAGALFCVYWFNRYILIRQLLAVHGIVPFLAGCVVFILVFSPPVCALLLLMPLNNVAEFTLIPSENHNPFDPFNYQLTFWLLVFSAPLILAFERQSQGAKLAAIAQQQTRTELQLLQQQVNPHFLFNTLNNLYALCLEQSEQAPEMVEKLAGLLRYTVYKGQLERVSLSEDIGYLQDYLALQRMRYTADCQFNCRWPEKAEDWSIPPLMLIIVLENAFKHGIEKAPKPCELTLSVTLRDNTLVVECMNPLPPASQAAIDTRTSDAHGDSGLGLDNLKRRLALQFPQKHLLVSESKGDVWHTRLEMELAPC